MQINRCSKCMQEVESYPCPHCGFDPEKYKQLSYALPLNSILNGQYLIGKMLGQGGFGMTYVGWDLVLEAKVAIKEFYPSGLVTRHPEVGRDLLWNSGQQARDFRTTGMENFLKEARKMMRLDNIPVAVRVLNTFFENETAYIVMEYIDGETLSQKMKREGTFSWQETKEIFFPLIKGMANVHEAGLIHRDVSPDNIMIQADGKVRLLDLGAAKDMTINTGASSVLVAKPGFSPIEQYTQRGNSAPSTDVYAMAATIYYVLTGSIPPSSTDRINEDTMNWEHPKLAGLPEGVVEALQNAMQIQAKQRTQTMGELLAQLTAADAPVKKGGAGKWIAAAAGVLAAVGIGGFLMFGSRSPAPQMEAPVETAAVTQPAPVQTEAPAETEAVPEETEAVTEAPVAVVEDTRPIYTMKASEDLHLVNTAGYGARTLWGWPLAQRNTFKRIVFQDTLEGLPDKDYLIYDVSAAQDRSILAWRFDTDNTFTLHVGTDGGRIAANPDSRWLFAGFTQVTEIDFGDCFYTSDIENMDYMFAGTNKLTSLDLKFMDTAKVTSMNYVFKDCTGLRTIDLSRFNTANVTSMVGTFDNCQSLTGLDLTSFDTAKVGSMSGMFMNCRRITGIVMPNFDLSSCRNTSYMFADCYQLGSLDLTSFSPVNVTDMSYMFTDCVGLTSLTAPNFNTYKVTNMEFMFYGCTRLKHDFAAFDFSNVTSYQDFMIEKQQVNGRDWKAMFPQAR